MSKPFWKLESVNDFDAQKIQTIKENFFWSHFIADIQFLFSKNANDTSKESRFSPETDLSKVFPCLSSSACWDMLQPQHTSLSWTLFYRMFSKHSQLFAGPRTWKSSLGLQTAAGEPPKWPPEKKTRDESTAAESGPALGRRLLVISQSEREPAETPALQTAASKYQSTDRQHYWQASLRQLKIKSTWDSEQSFLFMSLWSGGFTVSALPVSARCNQTTRVLICLMTDTHRKVKTVYWMWFFIYIPLCTLMPIIYCIFMDDEAERWRTKVGGRGRKQ